MSGYRLAAPAREDLAEIWEFIAEESGEARTADRAVDAIIERLVMLADNPRAGRVRGEIGSGVRSFPAGAYIVYYRLGKGAGSRLRASCMAAAIRRELTTRGAEGAPRRKLDQACRERVNSAVQEEVQH